VFTPRRHLVKALERPSKSEALVCGEDALGFALHEASRVGQLPEAIDGAQMRPFHVLTHRGCEFYNELYHYCISVFQSYPKTQLDSNPRPEHWVRKELRALLR